jgi:hypothetical protein
MRRLGPIFAIVALVVASACARRANIVGDSQIDPVKVVRDNGKTRVTLTGDAARRLDIRRAVVKKDGDATVVPYASLLYTADGNTWVFASPAPLEFVRTRVVVADIRGDDAVLTSGPPVGTSIVTTGAAELLGAESGVGEQ